MNFDRTRSFNVTALDEATGERATLVAVAKAYVNGDTVVLTAKGEAWKNRTWGSLLLIRCPEYDVTDEPTPTEDTSPAAPTNDESENIYDGSNVIPRKAN